MAAQLGRSVLLKIDATGSGSYQSIASIRTKSMKIASETVDVSNADSVNQWRELLANAGMKSMEVSGNGLFDDGVYINLVNTLCLAGTIRNWQITLPSLGTYQAAFQITAFELNADYNGALEFSMTLASSGDMTFTPV